jgi:hypothetical protein
MKITIDEELVHDLIGLLQDVITPDAAVIEDRLIEAAEGQGLSVFFDGDKKPLWLTRQDNWAEDCKRNLEYLAKHLAKEGKR